MKFNVKLTNGLSLLGSYQDGTSWKYNSRRYWLGYRSVRYTLREKCPYSEFSGPYSHGVGLSPGKNGPEKLDTFCALIETALVPKFCCYPSNQFHLRINENVSHLIILNF